MKATAKFLRLDFLPKSPDFALLLLRVWVGSCVLLLHGWGKLTRFSENSAHFMNFLGLGSRFSYALCTFAEFFCSGLLILGLFTRSAALVLAINMAVAFMLAHKSVLKGGGNGELAFTYLAAYLVIFFAGGGRFSVDAKTGGKK